MDKHLYPGTQYRSSNWAEPGFLGVATVIEANPAQNEVKVLVVSDTGSGECSVNLDAVVFGLETGRYEFVLDDFTTGYLEAALWSTSDIEDNQRRFAEAAGFWLEQRRVLPEGVVYEPLNHEQAKQYARWCIFNKEGRVGEKSFEFQGSEDGAWVEAFHLAGGVGQPDSSLEANYGIEDCDPGLLKDTIQDCLDFQKAQADLLRVAYDTAYSDLRRNGHGNDSVEAFAGHDFWLTRNGHGAGFWDRGLGEVGDKLSEACEPYGSADFYVGDDRKIYL